MLTWESEEGKKVFLAGISDDAPDFFLFEIEKKKDSRWKKSCEIEYDSYSIAFALNLLSGAW